MKLSIRSCLPPIAGLATFLIMGFVGKVAFDTLVFDPPFHAHDDKATIRHYGDSRVVFQYWRVLEIREKTLGRVSRYVAHTPSGKTIELGASEQVYDKGIKHVYREFMLGSEADVEKGEWCLTATLAYQPAFSLVSHYYDAPKTCAVHE